MPRPRHPTRGMVPGLAVPRASPSRHENRDPSTTTRVIQINDRGATAHRGALRRHKAWTSRPCDRRPHYAVAYASVRTPPHRSKCGGHRSAIIVGAPFTSNPRDIGSVPNFQSGYLCFLSVPGRQRNHALPATSHCPWSSLRCAGSLLLCPTNRRKDRLIFPIHRITGRHALASGSTSRKAIGPPSNLKSLKRRLC